jgi:hypothetical protein
VVVFLVPNEEKDAYVEGEPADDARFVDVLATRWTTPVAIHQRTPSGWRGPCCRNIMRYDPTRPVVYPDKGRTLTDDVTDPFMAILTNGKASDDMVGPHDDLLPEFPYLGPPHENRTDA